MIPDELRCAPPPRRPAGRSPQAVISSAEMRMKKREGRCRPPSCLYPPLPLAARGAPVGLRSTRAPRNRASASRPSRLPVRRRRRSAERGRWVGEECVIATRRACACLRVRACGVERAWARRPRGLLIPSRSPTGGALRARRRARARGGGTSDLRGGAPVRRRGNWARVAPELPGRRGRGRGCGTDGRASPGDVRQGCASSRGQRARPRPTRRGAVPRAGVR